MLNPFNYIHFPILLIKRYISKYISHFYLHFAYIIYTIHIIVNQAIITLGHNTLIFRLTVPIPL